MIIILNLNAKQNDIDKIVQKVQGFGLKTNISQGVNRTVIGVIGAKSDLSEASFDTLSGVEKVVRVSAPYKLVSREFKPENSIIQVNESVSIGGEKLVVMAGPCSIESYEGLRAIAKKVKASGAAILRGGAFKPRTSPYDFQGMGEDGLKALQDVAQEFDLATVTEVMDPRDVGLVSRYADILQLGARNMQNHSLLKEVGKIKKPVFLKRGMSATVQELLMSAEYILSAGNYDVVLCERGIRTFETATRNTLDINAIGVIKQLSHLPIIVDPSHATGRWGLVGGAAKAGVAAGCDGLQIEVHDHPENAVSDGAQSLLPERFDSLMKELRLLATAVSRSI